MQQLEKDQIKIEDWWSQCHGNVGAMAGHRSGVQHKKNIKKQAGNVYEL